MASSSLPTLYSNDEYEIRPAKNNDEYRLTWWCFMLELGWNRGYHDLDTYMNISVGYGMILLIHKATNKPVGHISAVINPNKTGWVSMFIIDAEHRGKGMGRELFKCAIADFERNGTEIVGLDGVPMQKQTYERRGFVDSPLGLVKLMTRPLVSKEPLRDIGDAQITGHVIDIRAVPQHLLVQHESKYTGFERPKLWSDELMFNRPDAAGVAFTSTAHPQSLEDLRGWAMIRRASGGPRIGPVYADCAAAATVVLATAMSLTNAEYVKHTPLPGDSLGESSEAYINEKAMLVTEVWGGNPEAVEVFETLGFKDAGFSYHRMWVDGKATPEFSEGGAAQRGVFAIFDAAIG